MAQINDIPVSSGVAAVSLQDSGIHQNFDGGLKRSRNILQALISNHTLLLQSRFKFRPLGGADQITGAVFSRDVKMPVHVGKRDIIFCHQFPPQRRSVFHGGLAGLVDPVAGGIAQLDGKAVGVGDLSIHGTAAGGCGVGIFAAAHCPGHPQIRHGPVYAGIIHKVVGAGLDDVVLKIGGVVGGLIPVVSGVVEHQVFDLGSCPGPAVISGVCQTFFQEITHNSSFRTPPARLCRRSFS